MKRNDIDHNTKSFIDLMDLDELVSLNEYIVKRIRFISDTKAMKKSRVLISMTIAKFAILSI